MQKDIILILNASEGILQIVVGQRQEDKSSLLLCHQEWDCPKNCTERLSPLIKEIFKKLDLPLSRIYRIASLTGAGSFTGIRLCLATSSALSRALKTEQVAIDFLHALAYNAPIQIGNKIRVISHAKRNLVHLADFIVKNDSFLEQIDKTSLTSPEFAFSDSTIDYILGSGVEKYKENLKDSIKIKHLLPIYTNRLNPSILLDLANNASPSDKDLEAEYVRSCDALDNLEHISQKLGNSHEDSLALFNTLTKDKTIHKI